MYKLLILLVLPCLSHATVSDGSYIGIEAGLANQIVKFNASAFNVDANGATLYKSAYGITTRLNLGYNIDEYNGFELGINYNLTTNITAPTGDSAINAAVWSFDGSYILSLPTAIRKLSAFGRVGVAYNWMPTTNNSSGCNCSTVVTPSTDISGSSISDVLGAGIKYNINRNTSFRIEWLANGIFLPMPIKVGNQEVAMWTNQTFQIGINYHF